MPLILLSFDEMCLSTNSANAFWSLIPGYKDQNFFYIRDQDIFPDFAALT